MEYKKDLVSVIIPTYNQENFIAETLESVLQQTYTNLEIIVMDDGSTDNNPKVISEYAKKDPRIVPVLSGKNGGFSSNVNKGLKLASGEFIAKLDGDDIMMPDKIERQVSFLKQHQDYVLVCHDMEVFNSDDNAFMYRLSEKGIMAQKMEDWAFYTNWWFAKPAMYWVYSSVLARTTYLTHTFWDVRVPYKNEILHMIGNQSFEPKGKWHLMPEVLGRYRYFPESMSRKKRDPNYKLEEAYVCFAIALIKFPFYAKRIVRTRKYNLYMHILTAEDIDQKSCLNVYLKEYGLVSYLCILLMRFLLKSKVIFVLNKPIRMFYKYKYGIT